MKYYTKEFHELLQSIGTAEMFSPVMDREVYTDDDIEEIYEIMLDQHIEEERQMFDEPPFFVIDCEDDITPEEFDPEDFLIVGFDENGEEVEPRHPDSYEELVEFQNIEKERALEEYENRGEFDEELAREEFEEGYRDNLEEPDEDIPAWVRETVDPRMLAMWAVPESVYKRLLEEEEENQAKFDELEAAADDALEDMYAAIPDEYPDLMTDLDWLDGDYVTAMGMTDGDYVIGLAGWDEDGEAVVRTLTLIDAAVIEEEPVSLEVEIDEDDDLSSNCDLVAHEVYFEDGIFELHLLLDNEGYKYVTVRCTDIQIEQQPH